jgi:glycosyltransferase involved in cell wall biosynthesis
MSLTTLHILSNPYGITSPLYRMEPFSQAVLKFVNNMQGRSWNLIHYGHESSQVSCEHVTVVTNKENPPPEESNNILHKPEILSFVNKRIRDEIGSRKKPGDIILCFYGFANKDATEGHSDCIITEPSIGYWPDGVFAPYRAFVSYAHMHYYYGLHKMLLKPSWWDTVIPNAMTPSEFIFDNQKEDYVVYLGRINPDKGVDICIQATKAAGKRLIVAGPGSLKNLGYNETPSHVEHIGYVNAEQRAKLLSKASCLMAPTHYLEPFGNIVAEAQMCGTPVITCDWGGFVDNVWHGFTGYRCKDFNDFVTALDNIKNIDPVICKKFAMENFSDDVVHNKFDKWFKKLKTMNWYAR